MTISLIEGYYDSSFSTRKNWREQLAQRARLALNSESVTSFTRIE
jgi:hypothetical protein